MRGITYDCPIELLETEWRYIGDNQKVRHHDQEIEVHEYRCKGCNRATIYLTNQELRRVITSNKKLEGKV